MLKDFGNAFSYAFSAANRNKATKEELEKALRALIIGRKTLYYSGSFITIFSVVVIMISLNDISSLGPNISVALLSMVYALLGVLPLLSLEGRICRFIASLSEE